MNRLGIDLGGSKIEAVVLDDDGAELFRQRVATPRGDYAAGLEAIAALVERAEQAAGPAAAIGIGTPGDVSRVTGRMKNCNSVWLNGRPLPADLRARLGREFAMANDANCFALSEGRDGAAAGAGVVFGVILGTGVGGGIAVNGRVLAGANGIAGEWGHNPLPWAGPRERPGPACWCGRNGCIETFLSGPGMAADHLRYAGEELDARTIAARAAGGDGACDATLRRYEERMARSLAHVINVLDPDVIVLGGGMSGIERLYDNVPALWGRHVFSDRVDTRLAAPRHGDSSGVRGAAWLGERATDGGAA